LFIQACLLIVGEGEDCGCIRLGYEAGLENHQFLGLIVARGMNRTHRARTNWGLKQVEFKSSFLILDVGLRAPRRLWQMYSGA
jgi:hypothetical protein